MPAGQSKLGIWNIALIELGEDPLTNITTANTKQILCAARYDDARQAVIRDHPWNSTKKYASLPASLTPPAFTWENAFALPPDFLRMNRIEDDLDADWEVVGNQLYTDQTAPLNIVYHWDLQDVTQFDALMVRCIGYDLALEIGPSLVRDDARMQRIALKLKDKAETAKLVDSQEDSPREWDDDILLRSRR